MADNAHWTLDELEDNYPSDGAADQSTGRKSREGGIQRTQDGVERDALSPSEIVESDGESDDSEQAEPEYVGATDEEVAEAIPTMAEL